MDFLERIQAKPSHVKVQYAFLFALVTTGAIAVVWASTIPARFADQEVKPQHPEESDSLNEMFNSAKEQLGSVTESIREIKEEPIVIPEVEETNMDALNFSATPSTTSSREDISLPIQNTEEEHTMTSDKQMNDIPQAPEMPLHPKVILIGTTTSKLSN